MDFTSGASENSRNPWEKSPEFSCQNEEVKFRENFMKMPSNPLEGPKGLDATFVLLKERSSSQSWPG